MKRTKFATTSERASFMTDEKSSLLHSTAVRSVFLYTFTPEIFRICLVYSHFSRSSISNICLNLLASSIIFTRQSKLRMLYIRFFYLSLVNTSLVNSAKQHTTSLKLCCDFRKCFTSQRMSVWNSVRSRSSHNGWMLICETWNMHYKSTLPPKKSIHMQEQSVVEYIARHILSLVLFI